jgi:hypothetical protein
VSQKEDILGQIVEEYLRHQGFFVQRNVKYKPNRLDEGYESKSDSVPSDIDVLAIHPLRSGADSVLAVNIKSWQSGFNFKTVIAEIENNKRVAGRSSERRYREFAIPRWSLAFRSAIQNATGSKLFTHVLAVTLAKGDPTLWEQYGPFREAMAGNPLKVVTLSDMVLAIEERLTTTPAATDIGRTLQLFKAAGLRPRPSPPVQTTDVPDDEK